MKSMRKMLCILLSTIMFIFCLTGCSEEVVRDPNGLLYDTFEEFEANGVHKHPETDANLRYALYDTYVQVIEYISEEPHITIPHEYKGLPVISIREAAFKDSPSLERVTFGQNLLHIGKDAFAGCVNLSQVDMSAKVNVIETGAFANCQALKSIIIPPQVTELKSGTFSGCSSLTKVIVESNLSLLAAADAENQEDVRGQESIADTKRVIEGNTFSDCTSLRIMWIPEDISEVNQSILGGNAQKPLICGGDGTASAYFATLQCLDYELVSRDDFDAQARWYSDVDLIDRTPMGHTITSGHFNIRLDDVKYYDKLGSVQSGENATLLVAKFTISQGTQISQYFDGFNVTCTSTAPGKDGLTAEFRKTPILFPMQTLGYSYPAGTVGSKSSIEGVIVLKVSSRFESVKIEFADTTEAFII